MNYQWRSFFTFLLSAVVLTGCIRNIILIRKGDVSQKEFYAQFPFEVKMGLIVVKAKINGSDEEYEFIFDTGAYMTLISLDLAKKLNLNQKGNTLVFDSQKNKKFMKLATLDTVQMGEVKFINKGTNIYPIPENSYLKCIAKDGIIGANIIRDCNWDIDFANHIITISNKELKPDNEAGIKFRKTYSGKPYTTVDVAGNKITNVLIDMGSNGGFDIKKRHVNTEYTSIQKNTFVKKYDGTSQGIWGSSYDTAYSTYFDTAYIGKNQEAMFTQFPVRVRENTSTKIGLEALGDYRIYLNYSNRTLYFKRQYQDTAKAVEEGFGVIFNLADSNVFIGSIYDGSPAMEAGLKVGDQVTEVNGCIPNTNFGDVCGFIDWMRGVLYSEKELTLTINNEERLITLKRAKYKLQAYPYLKN